MNTQLYNTVMSELAQKRENVIQNIIDKFCTELSSEN